MINKIIFTIYLCIVFSVISHAQTNSIAKDHAESYKEYDKLFEKVRDRWTLDNNNCVTFEKIIEAKGIKRDELFKKIRLYFDKKAPHNEDLSYNISEYSAMMTGTIIDLAKTWPNTSFGVSYVYRVETKDNRIRATITARKFFIGGTYEFIDKDFPFHSSVGKKYIKKTICEFIKYVDKNFDELSIFINSDEDDNW